MRSTEDLMRMICIALAAAALSACADRPPQHPEASTRAPAPTRATRAFDADKTPKPVSPSLSVGADILALCKIDEMDVARAPKFDFDSSELTSEDAQILDKIADCMTSGPLKRRALKLVGRADPRGTVEYNF